MDKIQIIQFILSSLFGTIAGAWIVFGLDKYRRLKEEHKKWCKHILELYENGNENDKEALVVSGILAKAMNGINMD